MDVPSYSKPLFLTNAVINIDPDLEAKRMRDLKHQRKQIHGWIAVIICPVY